MRKETNNLVLEVSVGIVLYTAAAMAVAFLFFPGRAVYAGLLLGMAIALLMFFSMAMVLDRSMKSEDGRLVQKRTVISAVVRYLSVLIVLAAVEIWFSDRIHIVALIIGIFGLKAGAYLQPVLHRAFLWKKDAG